MKEYKTKSWQLRHTGTDGMVTLFGVNIFDYKWLDTHRTATVFAPGYRQKCIFPVYSVSINDEMHDFAAGELSNNIWGFYTYDY